MLFKSDMTFGKPIIVVNVHVEGDSDMSEVIHKWNVAAVVLKHGRGAALVESKMALGIQNSQSFFAN